MDLLTYRNLLQAPQHKIGVLFESIHGAPTANTLRLSLQSLAGWLRLEAAHLHQAPLAKGPPSIASFLKAGRSHVKSWHIPYSYMPYYHLPYYTMPYFAMPY